MHKKLQSETSELTKKYVSEETVVSSHMMSYDAEGQTSKAYNFKVYKMHKLKPKYPPERNEYYLNC